MSKKTTLLSCLLALAIILPAQTARFATNKTIKSYPVQLKNKIEKNSKKSFVSVTIANEQLQPVSAHSNMIKASKITQAAPVAIFKRPSGTYIPSMIGNADPDYLGYSYPYSGIAGSAYSIPWTFRNKSTGATGYSWSWGSTSNYSTDTNVVLKDSESEFLSAGYLYSPELKAGNGPDSASYKISDGGQTEGAVLYSSTEIMYMGNADYYGNSSEKDSYGNSITVVTTSSSTQLSGSGEGYFWGTCLRNQDGTNGTKVQSIVSVYEKPMAPLTIKDICYFGLTDVGVTPVPADKSLTATIIKINEAGQLTTDTIASATISGGEVIVQDQQLVYLPFTFTEKDPETGREAPFTPVITDGFAIILSDISQDGMNFGLFSDYKNTLESTSYFTKADAQTGVSDGKMYKSSSTGMNIYLTMNSYFNYMYVSPETKVLTAPVEGGEAVDAVNNESGAVISTFFYDVQDSITTEDLIWLKDSLPDWIDLSYSNEYYSEYGVLIFMFTAEALPAELTERSADITLQSYGAEATITVKQGSSNGLHANKAANTKVIPNVNGYKLFYNNGFKSLQILNTAGQTIETHTLNESGTYQLDTKQLAKGVYFLKLSGSKTETVKIVN